METKVYILGERTIWYTHWTEALQKVASRTVSKVVKGWLFDTLTMPQAMLNTHCSNHFLHHGQMRMTLNGDYISNMNCLCCDVDASFPIKDRRPRPYFQWFHVEDILKCDAHMPKIPFKIDGDAVSREIFRQMFTNSEVPCPLMTRPTSIWIGGQQIPVTHEAISPCVILWPSSQVGMTLLLKFSELKNTSKIQLVGRGSDGKRSQWYDMHKLGQNPGDECEKTIAHDLDMLNWTSSGCMMVGFEQSYVGCQAILFPRSSESVILYSVNYTLSLQHTIY